MSNVELARRAKLSAWRHMALGTWRTAYDPSIYGTVSLRIDEALRYIDRFRAATGRHLTLSHMMAKVVGVLLRRMPEINAILRWNRIYLRKNASVFFQVAIENPATGEIDLSGLKVEDPESKSLIDIIDEFESRAAKIRAHQDRELERSRGMLHHIPSAFVGLALRVLSFLSYTLNVDLRWAGVPKDPFGSVMVTNIGSLGLEAAYAPLVPFSRVPLLVSMGEVEDVPRVEDGEIVARKIMRLFATFDHRVIDGAHAAKMVRIVREWLEAPFEHFEAVSTPDETHAEAPVGHPG